MVRRWVRSANHWCLRTATSTHEPQNILNQLRPFTRYDWSRARHRPWNSRHLKKPAKDATPCALQVREGKKAWKYLLDCERKY
ncbi:MAG TPA: hypothetical protein VF480_03655 [Verrucomicrobiae bacterium]